MKVKPKMDGGVIGIWGEKDGKRGVNEICTHLYNYLQQVDQEGRYRKIRLYCDNCPGQNKNRIILTMFLFFLKTLSLHTGNWNYKLLDILTCLLIVFRLLLKSMFLK